MESHLSEEALWASGLSARLRLIQANFADDPASTRQEYIVEEIQRALKSVSPTRKKGYLDALAERFPAWEGVRSSAQSDVKLGAAPLTAEELVDRLVELAPALSPEARVSFAGRLGAVGLIIKESPDAFLELTPELMKKLNMPAGKHLQLERAVKMLIETLELGLALDQLAWVLWKQMNPRSTIKRELELSRMAGSYLAGDQEVSTTQVKQTVERTRRLISAMLTAFGRAGPAYAKRYLAELAPDLLEDWARMEKKMMESLEAACWRKFLEKAKEHATDQAIEQNIQEALAKAAEDIFLRRVAA